MGKLRVIITTQALAIGVNVPCKTVVFLKDSSQIKALQYHQMSGRAGRRGFDTLGYTVFLQFPMKTIRSLVLGPLQLIESSPTMDINIAIKILIMLDGYKDKEAALGLCRKLFSSPLNSSASYSSELIFFYYIQFLRHFELITADAKPTELAAFLNHTSFLFPTNFLLVHLITTNSFGSIFDLVTYDDDERRRPRPISERQRKRCRLLLLNILAYIMVRVTPAGVRIQSGDKVVHSPPASNEQNEERKVLRLPRYILQKINDFNNSVKTFTNHIFLTLKENQEKLGIDQHQIRSLAKFTVPTFDVISPSDLNTYIVDFYESGQISLLRKKNNLNHTAAYSLLKEFVFSLKKLRSGLQYLWEEQQKKNGGYWNILFLLDELTNEYQNLFNSIEY